MEYKKNLKEKLGDLNLVRLIVLSIFVIVLMSFIVPSRFFGLKNFQSMSFQFPEFGLFSIAMALAMFTGGADLSIVSTGNLAAIVGGKCIKQIIVLQKGIPDGILVLVALLIALVVGVICGLINGFLISKAKIPPILTTLGTMQLFSGVSIILTRGTSLYGFPESFNNLGNGFFLDVIPYPLVIFVIMAAIFTFVIQKTSFGVKLFFIGSNRMAASYSGINCNDIITKSYLFSGILSAVAGFIILARTNSANADYGGAYILQAMLVAIMGGVDPRGGRGKITGIIIAIITLQLLSSGLNMLNVNIYFKQVVFGGLLLVMVILNRKNK